MGARRRDAGDLVPLATLTGSGDHLQVGDSPGQADLSLESLGGDRNSWDSISASARQRQ
jgi:hypothetical protein